MTTQTRLMKAQRFGVSGVAVQVWFRALHGAAGVARNFGIGRELLDQPRAGAQPERADLVATAALDTVVVSDEFAQAVRDNSNLELDWLWLAGRVSSSDERSYCFRRALEINPECEIARRALRSR